MTKRKAEDGARVKFNDKAAKFVRGRTGVVKSYEPQDENWYGGTAAATYKVTMDSSGAVYTCQSSVFDVIKDEPTKVTGDFEAGDMVEVLTTSLGNQGFIGTITGFETGNLILVDCGSSGNYYFYPVELKLIKKADVEEVSVKEEVEVEETLLDSVLTSPDPFKDTFFIPFKVRSIERRVNYWDTTQIVTVVELFNEENETIITLEEVDRG